jgi:hypothetical protein
MFFLTLSALSGWAYLHAPLADSVLEKKAPKGKEDPAATAAKTVCVCEILKLANNNISHSDMAILAEANYKKQEDAGVRKASHLLEVGKKNMRNYDFDQVLTREKLIGRTDCITFLRTLRKQKGKIRVYEMLDATASR